MAELIATTKNENLYNTVFL